MLQDEEPSLLEELERSSTAADDDDDEDELDTYLAQPVEATADPLKWWTERAAIFPRLSRMARDYLSIPGMFTSCLVRSHMV